MEGVKKLLALVAVGLALLLVASAYIDEELSVSVCAKADTLASIGNLEAEGVWEVDPESPAELEIKGDTVRCAAAAAPEGRTDIITLPILYQVDIQSGDVKVVTESDAEYSEFVRLLGL